MSAKTGISRRDFIKLTAGSGAALVLGFYIPSKRETLAAASTGEAASEFEPNAYLVIDTDGNVTLRIHRSEMGQQIQTAVAMILAEELEADWTTIQLVQAPADRVYGDQNTGGSASISGSYHVLRQAGATARLMFIQAAAQLWGVEPDACYAENGMVIHEPDGQQLSYGDLVGTAAQLPVPSTRDVPLKDPADFRIIGTPMGQFNELDIVTGRAVYGSDIKLPGMLYAAIARCPVFGGSLVSYDSSAAEAIDGVLQVVDASNRVVVIANSTWAAIEGRDMLDITWNEGQYADLDSDGIRATLIERVESIAGEAGNDSGITMIEADYETPYLAHATMEPMNCTADMRDDGGDIWSPTQNRQGAQSTAGSLVSLSPGTINIHVPMIGSGFGRRLQNDYTGEAAVLSKMIGAPVKVVWTRDDDMQHDYYTAVSYHRMRAGIDADGNPVSWEHYVATPESNNSIGSRIPYDISQQYRANSVSFPVPTGAWRAVFSNQNAFANECFIDELAAAAGKDPYAFRMELLPDSDPMKPVLERAATKAGWGTPLPEGWARGIACHSTFNVTPVAQVVELSLDGDTIRVHRVVCAIDCGVVINPDGVIAQMEGGIAFGLTAVLKGEITLKNGRVEQSGFRNYRPLRIGEMPKIEVYLMDSTRSPSGVGEMGVPPIAPAVANAVSVLTGKRVRSFPIRIAELAD
jgi:isoquinoline 1-oxidoreductase beta subunit